MTPIDRKWEVLQRELSSMKYMLGRQLWELGRMDAEHHAQFLAFMAKVRKPLAKGDMQ